MAKFKEFIHIWSNFFKCEEGPRARRRESSVDCIIFPLLSSLCFSLRVLSFFSSSSFSFCLVFFAFYFSARTILLIVLFRTFRFYDSRIAHNSFFYASFIIFRASVYARDPGCTFHVERILWVWKSFESMKKRSAVRRRCMKAMRRVNMLIEIILSSFQGDPQGQFYALRLFFPFSTEIRRSVR